MAQSGGMTDDQSLVAAGKEQEGAALAQRLMAVPATVPAPGLLAAQVPSGVQELPPPAASTNHPSSGVRTSSSASASADARRLRLSKGRQMSMLAHRFVTFPEQRALKASFSDRLCAELMEALARPGYDFSVI